MSQNPFASPRDIGEPAPLVDFKDRSTGLLAFGVLEIILGLISGLLVPFTAVTTLMSPQPMPAWAIVPGLAMYGLAAVVGIWLGIGSIQARRWARALVLALAWPWLVFGVVATIATWGMLPTMYAQLARDSRLPQVAVVIMLVVAGTFTALFYIVLPAGFVAFYQSRHVKATCERKDTKPRWTDRCPQPVLTLAVMFAFGAYSLFWSAVCGGMVLMFGQFLHGWPGAAICLGIALVCGLVAWGAYRQRMLAWWAALVLALLAGASAAMSRSADRLTEMYQQMGFSGDQLASMKQVAGTVQQFGGPAAILFGLLFVGYLFAIRQYFVAAASDTKSAEVAGSPSEQ